ncbi:uncharacterized protein ACNS7B_001539 [Menidia menidia]
MSCGEVRTVSAAGEQKLRGTCSRSWEGKQAGKTDFCQRTQEVDSQSVAAGPEGRILPRAHVGSSDREQSQRQPASKEELWDVLQESTTGTLLKRLPWQHFNDAFKDTIRSTPSVHGGVAEHQSMRKSGEPAVGSLFSSSACLKPQINTAPRNLEVLCTLKHRWMLRKQRDLEEEILRSSS